MMTYQSDIDVATGHSVEWHMRHAKQLQAEAVKAGAMAAFASIKSLFSNHKPATTGNHADAGMACGHV